LRLSPLQQHPAATLRKWLTHDPPRFRCYLVPRVQFQSFSQYRAKFEGKSEEEMGLLRGNPQIWNVHIVLNVLHSLIEKSKINEQLAEYRKGDNPQEVAGEFGSRTLYKMLGYFSLVGLLRLHVLLGTPRQ